MAVCENGKFVGYVEDNGVLTFKGIPFAKAPVGELRWKAPQPVEASDEGEVASHGDLSEDCLYLNIWTKELRMQKDRPVMVWFHGGSYGWGGTVDPLYEGKYLVAEYPDVVLVSVEYRVNAMGFIDFVDVPGGEAFPDAPYLGILDQQQALRWIQKNISAFGGDPGNVTIFGESAGGGSVSAHLIAKGSEGLFRRAIPMSGEIHLEHTSENYKATGQTAKLLAATGCKDMDGLMALSEADILKALNTEAGGKGKTYMYIFGKGLEKGAMPGEDYVKAGHACELTYAFNNAGYEKGGPYDPALAKRFSNIFVNFARTGNPSIEGLDIPEYEKNDRSTIIVGRDSQIYVEKNPLAKETELLLPTFYNFFLKR